jgi:hypothetical protein
VVALAVLVSACGGGSSSSSEDPQKVIDKATLEGVESGNLDISLKVKSAGEKSGGLHASVSGPFQGGAKGELPEADLEASVHGEAEGKKIDFDGGVTLLSDRAYISYEGEEYEVDPTTFGFVKSGFEQDEQKGGGGEGEACQEAAAGLEVGDFLDNLHNQGGVDIEGTQTTEISGDLDVSKAIDQITKLTENPACSGELEAAGPLPLGKLEEAKEELSSQVKNAHASVYVGEEDHIIRKLSAELTIEPKDSKGKSEVEFELTLGGVNEKQAISAPPSAKPLEQLFQKIGINPLELLEGGSGGLSGLLEGLTGGGGSSGGGIELPEVGESKAYLECLQQAESASDLQECANLAPQ